MESAGDFSSALGLPASKEAAAACWFSSTRRCYHGFRHSVSPADPRGVISEGQWNRFLICCDYARDGKDSGFTATPPRRLERWTVLLFWPTRSVGCCVRLLCWHTLRTTLWWIWWRLTIGDCDARRLSCPHTCYGSLGGRELFAAVCILANASVCGSSVRGCTLAFGHLRICKGIPAPDKTLKQTQQEQLEPKNNTNAKENWVSPHSFQIFIKTPKGKDYGIFPASTIFLNLRLRGGAAGQHSAQGPRGPNSISHELPTGTSYKNILKGKNKYAAPMTQTTNGPKPYIVEQLNQIPEL